MAALSGGSRDDVVSLATDRGAESYLRRKGREFLLVFHGAIRNVKLYPADNAVVGKSIGDLMEVTEQILRDDREVELRISGEFIFLNGTRLRVDMDSFASTARLLGLFREAGIGLMRVGGDATTREWYALLSNLQMPPASDPDTRRFEIMQVLELLGIHRFELGPPTDSDEEFREKAKEAAKRVYTHSVSVTKDVINSVRMGASPNIKKIKRVVQGIIDQILTEESSLVGLTTLRDYDEYTFTHSVNVCIFAVALGRKLGFTRMQLYDLGIAALMHDIGKTRIPLVILTKPAGLLEDEWRIMACHPWMGVLALSTVRGLHDMPYRAMVVAFEHHKKTDLTGYPRHIRPRELSIFSKIVCVVDAFDAATSRRTYQTSPLSPSAVLHEMRGNVSRGMDQAVVKAFMSLVGTYPVGTLLVLDTLEIAVVHAVNPMPEAISRPIVRMVSDAQGHLQYPGSIVDLAEKHEGEFKRTIIKIADPERYGIKVSDYFV